MDTVSHNSPRNITHKRLNPRKADLHRWREVFAEKLRGYGVDAEATRQATRGVARNHPHLWRLKAAEEGRLRKPQSKHRTGSTVVNKLADAEHAWQAIATALAGSSDRPIDTWPTQSRASRAIERQNTTTRVVQYSRQQTASQMSAGAFCASFPGERASDDNLTNLTNRTCINTG